MSKYDPLYRWLGEQSGVEISVTFAEVERIIAYPLPASARGHSAWWANENPDGRHVQSLAWTVAGWHAYPALDSERVTFHRISN